MSRARMTEVALWLNPWFIVVAYVQCLGCLPSDSLSLSDPAADLNAFLRGKIAYLKCVIYVFCFI